jgi:hypothetical protein
VMEFLRFHLPRCRCRPPAPKVPPDCRASLRRLVEFLRSQKRIKEPAEKTAPQSPVKGWRASRLRAADTAKSGEEVNLGRPHPSPLPQEQGVRHPARAPRGRVRRGLPQAELAAGAPSQILDGLDRGVRGTTGTAALPAPTRQHPHGGLLLR